ncbi:hypothetical protein BKA56DRAFT_39245 [Ilyonectria sp. MPI-CAGE-AT-0026]|nr:hypothetical protein BKA56DRAFT_39245 [Ilyonectria sp. MPI-CAGE-AT-0026]
MAGLPRSVVARLTEIIKAVVHQAMMGEKEMMFHDGEYIRLRKAKFAVRLGISSAHFDRLLQQAMKRLLEDMSTLVLRFSHERWHGIFQQTAATRLQDILRRLNETRKDPVTQMEFSKWAPLPKVKNNWAETTTSKKNTHTSAATYIMHEPTDLHSCESFLTDCQKQILGALLRDSEISNATDGKENPDNFMAKQDEAGDRHALIHRLQ